MLDIKVLGTGCPNCIRLENLCKEIVSERNWEAKIEKITDFNEFGNYGVMMTPGLVINGKVLSQGKIPVKSTLEHWLEKEL
ncbi:MAG: glutaredoxin [Bacteroidetes bacterium GWC2_33_15]|nr:MAG: glutaredoxin [Bacteroidetes bacterium GWA2_33_15]OFX50438.1 MAG: glutaredoxin [Bacteroidetes bacterium GWC2_33_15]OFX66644.1 MAG: glutaredoxin [Bacteroidetes bacterium GWB2_32_14]OFX69262.1 MAG: glutaredoxin [Bacteroidetes bacterium GWD2_33_33]HAN18577.1 thioredoxin family protein [Bacteroidales bacterium]